MQIIWNPSIEVPLRRSEGSATFHPSAKLAVDLSADHAVGLEYFAQWGSVRRLSPPSRRDEMLYAVWDSKLAIGRMSVDAGRPVHSSGSVDKWVGKVGIQFDLD